MPVFVNNHSLFIMHTHIDGNLKSRLCNNPEVVNYFTCNYFTIHVLLYNNEVDRWGPA